MTPSGLFEPIPASVLGIEAALLAVTLVGGYLVLKLLPLATPRWITWLLSNETRSVLFVVAVALIARAALLPIIGIPEPRVNDEFGHLLAADTFSHFRLANATPPEWQHFETFHVNIRPTYHSMYPPAQGAVLAFGQIVFHQPWIGVYLCTAAMCGAICWALQAFFSPGWALLGGLIAVMKFALFGYWMNSYWGGSVAAFGGAIALGALIRLCAAERSSSSRAWLSCVFAMGLLVLANSRPYEGLAYSLPLLGYVLYKLVMIRLDGSQLAALVLPGIAVALAGLGCMAFYNHATTGNAFMMPYSLNHSTYWRMAFFVGQNENQEARAPDPVFAKFFDETARAFEYREATSPVAWAKLQPGRILQNWSFYIGIALTVPVVIGLLSSFRQRRLRITVTLFAAVSLAIAVCHYNFQHYFAPATVVVYVFAVEGLRYLWETAHNSERAFAIAVIATVALTTVSRESVSANLYTTFAIPDGRRAVMEQLRREPGRYLVLVSYDLDRHYPGAELVHDGAELRSENILWARSKGVAADAELCAAYGDRMFVAVKADDQAFPVVHLSLCR